MIDRELHLQVYSASYVGKADGHYPVTPDNLQYTLVRRTSFFHALNKPKIKKMAINVIIFVGWVVLVDVFAVYRSAGSCVPIHNVLE